MRLLISFAVFSKTSAVNSLRWCKSFGSQGLCKSDGEGVLEHPNNNHIRMTPIHGEATHRLITHVKLWSQPWGTIGRLNQHSTIVGISHIPAESLLPFPTHEVSQCPA